MCLQAKDIDWREYCDKEPVLVLEISYRANESDLVQNDKAGSLCSSYNSHDDEDDYDKSGWQSMASNQPEESVLECATGWPGCQGKGSVVYKPKVLGLDGKTQEQASPDLQLQNNQKREDAQDTLQHGAVHGVFEGNERQQRTASNWSNLFPCKGYGKNTGFLKSAEMDRYDGCIMACTKETSETFSGPGLGSAFSMKPPLTLDVTQRTTPSSWSLPAPSLLITPEIVYDNPLLPPLLPERATFGQRVPNAPSCMQLAHDSFSFPSGLHGQITGSPHLYHSTYGDKCTFNSGAYRPGFLCDHKDCAKGLHTLTMTSGKTILVTGGAGYIGSHAVIELIEAGYDIVVIDNLINASMESIRRVEKIVGKQIPSYNVDLLNKPALEEVFKKHKISAVIHFAGLKAVGESCELPLLYYKTNVGGTTNLLEVMEANAVFNLVFSSSATVYGTPQFLPLTEEHPVGSCTNPYGKSKYMIEQILQDISASNKKWNIVILRYFNPVGSHKSGSIGEDPQGIPNNLMPYIAQVAVGRREFLSVYGSDYDTPDGTGVRDYIHVVDLAQGHVAAVRKLDENCGLKIYNLGTGQGYSVLDMAKAFEKASGKQIAHKLADRRPGDVASCYSDPSLAAKELNWTAKKGLDEMCEDLWRWQSQNPQGFNTPQN